MRKFDGRLDRFERGQREMLHRLAIIEAKLAHMAIDDVHQMHRIDLHEPEY